MRLPRILVVALLIGCLAGCGDNGRGEASSSSIVVPICGEGGVGFMRVSAGGAMPPWSSLELGHTFFAVGPDCRFVAYETIRSNLGMAVEGTLDEDRARELSERLQLGRWEDLEPAHSLGSCRPDSGGISYFWADRSLGVAWCIEAPMLPADVLEIHDGVREVIEEVRSVAEPVSGPVRYMLTPVDEHVRDSIEFEGAPSWPLDVPPEVLAQPLPPDRNDDIFLEPTRYEIWLAEDEDAARLRSLRSALLNREFGTTASSTIPIRQPDGSRYRLSFRDVVVGFESKGRPIVPWLTEGHIRITAVVRAEVSRIDFTVFCEDAPNAIATGTLEHTYGSETTYWGGSASDLPAGHCRVELDAFGEGGSVDCVEYAEIGSSESLTVRPGWTESAIFQCGSSG